METSLLNQGITLMLVGMGTVFAFLTILVLAMSSIAAIVMRFATEAPGPASNDAGEEEIAAIGAAIAQHRKRR